MLVWVETGPHGPSSLVPSLSSRSLHQEGAQTSYLILSIGIHLSLPLFSTAACATEVFKIATRFVGENTF